MVGIEGEALQVKLQANANPTLISYTWTKDGLPILAKGEDESIVSVGAVLNITKLVRSNAGIYTCEAINSQGSATINITVIVECTYSRHVVNFLKALNTTNNIYFRWYDYKICVREHCHKSR